MLFASTKFRHRVRLGFDSRLALLLCLQLISGALLAWALHSGAHPWLGLATLVPLFLAIKLLGVGGAALAGAVWSASTLIACDWFGVAPTSASWLSSAVFIALPAAYAAGGAYVTRSRGFDPLLLAVGWFFINLAHRAVGFERGLILDTFGDNEFILVVGKLGGSTFAAFLITLVIASLSAWAVEAVRAIVAVERRFSARPVGRILVAPAVRRERIFASSAQPRAPPR